MRLPSRELGTGGLGRDGSGEALEARRAMTAGMAPEEVRAIDTAREAQLKQATPGKRPGKSWRLVRPGSSSRAGTGGSTGAGRARVLSFLRREPHLA